MFLVVVPNPTIDRTLFVEKLRPGNVHRATEVRLAAGGKGLNVARTLRTLGSSYQLTGPTRGRTGRLFEDLAAEEGLRGEWTWLSSGETRSCHLLQHQGKDATVVNEPGPSLDETDWRKFAKTVDRLSLDANAVLLSGSLPPKYPVNGFREFISRLASREQFVFADTSGPALKEILSCQSGITIKVNRHEIEEALDLPRRQKVDQLAATLAGRLSRNPGAMIVTLGSEGALLVSTEGIWYATAPKVRVASSVGSGDVFLGAFVVEASRGCSPGRCLSHAVAAGTANALTPFAGVFDPNRIPDLLSSVNVDRLR